MSNRKKDYINFYIYKTTNLITGKIYVGQRSCNKLIQLDIRYIGSGKKLKLSIRKRGKGNFKKEIIEICTKENINDREIFWIKELDSMNPKIGYNLCKGGDTTRGYIFSEESIKKMSEAQSGEKSWQYGKRGELCHNFGRKPSEESIRKNREANSGENSSAYGKHLSKETSEKISKSHESRIKITCEYCQQINTKVNHVRYHGDNCKQNPNRSPTLYTCECCGLQTENKTNITRFHNENCKQNPNKLIS